ncbi:MAG: mandelate racemase/muconate lactonizing enzyme family protein [Kiloniellales bacterium]
MDLASVSCFLAGGGDSPDGWTAIKPILLVKVTAEDGTIGWGEAYVLTGRTKAVGALIQALGGGFRGRPATPRAFREFAFREFGDRRGGIDFFAALSAIELALWDLLGRQLEAPVHRLLGGALRERIPLYANVWSTKEPSPEAIVARCREHVAAGFHALKLYPAELPSLDDAEMLLERLREVLDPTVTLMVDVNGLEDPQEALLMARRFRSYDIYWLEEPVSSDDLATLAEIRQFSGMRIVSGERHGGKAPFRDILKSRAADILNPDIAGAGGIVEFLEIAALAEAHSARVSPHCYNSMSVAFAAMLQVSAVLPNLAWAEYFPALQAASDAFAKLDSNIVDGHASLPMSPGLGATPDENRLRPFTTA